jgi:hypothetical protein
LGAFCARTRAGAAAFDIKLGFILNRKDSFDSKKKKLLQRNAKVERRKSETSRATSGIARASLFFETYLELFHGQASGIQLRHNGRLRLRYTEKLIGQYVFRNRKSTEKQVRK